LPLDLISCTWKKELVTGLVLDLELKELIRCEGNFVCEQADVSDQHSAKSPLHAKKEK
jgi:hypothetical protein